MNYIKYLRITNGMTQRELAEKLGCHETEVSRMENGWLAKVDPSVERALAILFGPKWTFSQLMKLVPDLSSHNLESD